MTFETKEISLLLVIGFFFAGSIEVFWFLLFGRTLFPYKLAESAFPKLGTVGLVLATVLLLGLCIDAFSKRWVGRTSNSPSWAVPAPSWLLSSWWCTTYESLRLNSVASTPGKAPRVTQILLPPEREVRAHPLFNPYEGDPNGHVTALLTEVLNAKVMGRFGGPDGERLQYVFNLMPSYDQHDKDEINKELAPFLLECRLAACSELYYTAKNKLYQNVQYSTELRALEARVDFARSMALCFYGILCSMVAISAIRIVAALIAIVLRLAKPRHPCWTSVVTFRTWNRSTPLSNMAGAASLLVVAAIGLIMAHEAFLATQHAFNSRIFGYFVSLSPSPGTRQNPISNSATATPPVIVITR